MLNLNGVTIQAQDFGTVIAVFLTGQNQRDIQERFYSFWNFGITNGELEFWSDTCAMFWIPSDSRRVTAEDKFKKYLWKSALSEILQSQNTKGHNPLPDAIKLAQDRWASMDWVRWYSPKKYWAIHTQGVEIKAEKETGNFEDLLVRILQNNREETTPVIN